MSALFTINFRREAYLREVARVRRRMVALGVWVSYFGLLALVLGLYALNLAALTRRARQLETRVTQYATNRSAIQPWDVPRPALAQLERFVSNPRRWRTRLVRLAQLTPPNVALTGVAVNPNDLPGPASENLLVISGALRARPGEDRMQAIIGYVAALHGDPQFAAGYTTVKLTSSQASGGPDAAAEFTIECR